MFALASLKSPAELYVADADGRRAARAAAHQRATRSARVALGEPEQFTFAGANGETVYGYVMKPANFEPARSIRSPSSSTAARRAASAIRGAIAGIRRPTPARATRRCSSTSTARPATARRSPTRSAGTGAASRSRICRRASPPRSTKYPWLDGDRLRARRVVRRLHGQLDRRQLARAVQVPGQPRRHLRRAPWPTRPRSCGSTSGSTAARRATEPENYEKHNPVEPRHEVEDADARDPRRARLSASRTRRASRRSPRCSAAASRAGC